MHMLSRHALGSVGCVFLFLWMPLALTSTLLSKQASVSPHSESIGISMSINANSVSLDDEWRVTFQDQTSFDLWLSLSGATYGFHARHPSAITLVLHGTNYNTNEGDLLLAFAVADAEYFSVVIRNELSSQLYKVFPAPSMPLHQTNVTAMIAASTPDRYHRLTGDTQWYNTQPPYQNTAGESVRWPIKISVLNDPVANSVTYQFIDFESDVVLYSATYASSFASNRGLDVYLMTDGEHESFAIDDIDVQYSVFAADFNPTVSPTFPPSIAPFIPDPDLDESSKLVQVTSDITAVSTHDEHNGHATAAARQSLTVMTSVASAVGASLCIAVICLIAFCVQSEVSVKRDRKRRMMKSLLQQQQQQEQQFEPPIVARSQPILSCGDTVSHTKSDVKQETTAIDQVVLQVHNEMENARKMTETVLSNPEDYEHIIDRDEEDEDTDGTPEAHVVHVEHDHALDVICDQGNTTLDDDDDEEEEEDSMSASPLSTEAAAVEPPMPRGATHDDADDDDDEDNGHDHGHVDSEIEMKFIDDEDLISTKIELKPAHHPSNISSESNTLPLQLDHEHDDTVIIHHASPDVVPVDDDDEDDDEDDSSDDYGIATIKPEPKSAAQRTAAINQQRRKSSLLLKQQELALLQAHEDALQNGNTNGNSNGNGAVHAHAQNGGGGGGIDRSEPQIGQPQQQGAFLPVGDTNMDPYLLFWNNSKTGESVVKVVQDILLMSISRDINATHFGFGEFAILANVNDENELRRILKRILNKVSSNVHTVKLGPVTLCAGLAMYRRGGSISAWVNQCRQACRLAKTNGRGRIASYVSLDHRRKLAMDLMLEIKKPRVDFSGARVLELIRFGADLNVQFKYDTPLMVAIKKKNEVALRYLIQYEYNPNIQDKKGRTALILALEKECDTLMLELLVSKRDLNPRLKDYHDRSALSIALKKGYRDIAKTLILLGSEPLLGERSVLQKWFSAARMGNIQTIEGMIANMSFPIDMIDEQDMTALMISCQTGHLNLVKYLIKNGANVNIQGHRGYTALMFAIENSKIVIFSLLIQLADILIGLDGDDGTTILMCAAKGQMPEVVHVALHEDHAVDISARNADGNTALMIACMYGSDSVATELLRNHCDMDVKNKLKQNALILCALNGSSQIAAMLCTLGSLIDEQDRDGKTALIYASSHGHMGIAVSLIKYGANIDIADLSGMTALQYADKNGHHEIAKMISTGTLQDVTDLVAQMEILKQKNKALQRNVQSLTEINNELSDRINAAELAKNQIQKRLTDTMNKMKVGFTSNIHLPHFNKNPTMTSNASKEASESPPKPMQTASQDSSTNNTPQKIISGVSAGMRVGMRSMAGNFNKMFDQNNNNHASANQQKQPQPPSKDMKL